MKKTALLFCMIVMLIKASNAQEVTTTRLTHLLHETNQAEFDHLLVAQKGETMRVLNVYPNRYYKVFYKDNTYYVYYPYLSDVPGISELSIKMASADPLEADHLTNTKSTEFHPTSRPSQHRTIHTGPRGGRYYINSKGNKVYVKD